MKSSELKVVTMNSPTVKLIDPKLFSNEPPAEEITWCDCAKIDTHQKPNRIIVVNLGFIIQLIYNSNSLFCLSLNLQSPYLLVLIGDKYCLHSDIGKVYGFWGRETMFICRYADILPPMMYRHVF